MKSTIPFVAVTLVCLGALAFISSSCSDPEETAFTTPPVGVLKAADYEITLHTGAEGPLYSVRGPDGSELAREIDHDQLVAEFPKVAAEVTRLLADRKTWWAGNEAGQIQTGPVKTQAMPSRQFQGK